MKPIKLSEAHVRELAKFFGMPSTIEGKLFSFDTDGKGNIQVALRLTNSFRIKIIHYIVWRNFRKNPGSLFSSGLRYEANPEWSADDGDCEVVEA